jgi:uncharacterized protein RhaS with RHS repeats
MSTDPIHVMKQKLVDPQQWNMYAYVRNTPTRFTDPTGMYTCGGTKSQCASFKAWLANVRKAADSFKDGSKQRGALEKILSFYGSDIDKNGVNVGFAKLDKGVTFDPDQMHDIFGSAKDPKSKEAEDAGDVAHEGQHGVDRKERGDTHGFNAVKEDERRAYYSQSYVNEGLNVKSQAGIWDPNWRPSTADFMRDLAVELNAQENAVADCANGGCK